MFLMFVIFLTRILDVTLDLVMMFEYIKNIFFLLIYSQEILLRCFMRDLFKLICQYNELSSSLVPMQIYLISKGQNCPEIDLIMLSIFWNSYIVGDLRLGMINGQASQKQLLCSLVVECFYSLNKQS
jgi:hypothetical protein